MTDVHCIDCKRPIGVPEELYQEGIEYRCVVCELTANRTMDKKMLQVIADYKAKIDRLEAELVAKDKIIAGLDRNLRLYGNHFSDCHFYDYASFHDFASDGTSCNNGPCTCGFRHALDSAKETPL